MLRLKWQFQSLMVGRGSFSFVDFAFIVVLLAGMLISTFPQFALGILAPVLLQELGIQEGVFGLVASLTYCFAAVIARFAGAILDNVNARVGMLVLALAAAGSLIALAFSTSYRSLLIYSLFAGIGIAINNPMTNRLIALHIRPGSRGIVIAIKQGGVKLAQLAAGLTIPLMAVTIGWRNGLLALAIATLGIISLGFLAIPREEINTQSSSLKRRKATVIHDHLRWLQIYSVLMGVGISAMTTYLALYAVRELGLSLADAGILVAVFAAVGMASRICWAIGAERLARPGSALVPLTAIGIGGLSLVAAAQVAGTIPLWVGVILSGASVGSWNVVVQLSVLHLVDGDNVASGSGVVQSGFVVGLGVGAPVFGFVVQLSGGFFWSWMFCLCSVVFALIVAIRGMINARTAT